MQVLVRDNNVDQALRVLKKKMQREGILREMKQRKAYEKPSEKKAREKAEAVRRARKAARKQAQREGLIPAPKKVVKPARRRVRPRKDDPSRAGRSPHARFPVMLTTAAALRRPFSHVYERQGRPAAAAIPGTGDAA